MGRRQHAQTTDVARSRVAALGGVKDPAAGGRTPAHGGSETAPGVRDRAAGVGGAAPMEPAPVASIDKEPPSAHPDAPSPLTRYLPAVLRDADIRLGGRSLGVLVAVAVLVALMAGFLAWRARPDTVSVVAPPVVGASPAATPVQTIVAVSGQVRRPGLVRLPAGARVADALQAVGGALPGTDLRTLNLARKVVDGELIMVGAVSAGGAPAADPQQSGQPLDLNTATADQFDDLPGVGPVLAQNIVAYRTEHGTFRSVGELRQVDGIGDSRYERLKDLVRV